MAFGKLLIRSLRLRCPRCGETELYRNYWSMRPQCERCGFSFEREPGFYLGAIYFNYGLTALVATIAFPLLRFVAKLPPNVALLITLAFVVLFPLWYFRYARSLWLGFDQFIDPKEL